MLLHLCVISSIHFRLFIVFLLILASFVCKQTAAIAASISSTCFFFLFVSVFVHFALSVYVFELANRVNLCLSGTNSFFYTENQLYQSTNTHADTHIHIKFRAQKVPNGRFLGMLLFTGSKLLLYVNGFFCCFLSSLPSLSFPFSGTWSFLSLSLFLPFSLSVSLNIRRMCV